MILYFCSVFQLEAMKDYTAIGRRVDAMSEAFEKAERAVCSLKESLEAFRGIEDTVAELDGYMRSGQWLEDYEADEAGKLPGDIRRGVLSQDALYDLLQEYDSVRRLLRSPRRSGGKG